MNKVLAIAAVCCILPVLIIGFIFLSNRNKTTTSTNKSTSQISETSVGDTFLDFSLTEVSGQAISRDSLKGKPAIIWFTTSWCVPCQIGAKEVARLDNELGGSAFNVLVIFVDLNESDSDLLNWRKNFANPDWMVAFDNQLTQLAARVNLQFLDSKFLLDKNGVIRNIDFKVADESYLNTIREVVREN